MIWAFACIACYWIGYVCAHAYPNKKLTNWIESRSLNQKRLNQKRSISKKFYLEVKRQKKH